jgi:hypothetical protein
MTEEEKKKAAAVGTGIVIIAAIFLCLRGKEQEPDKAMLFGEVTDLDTGEPINNISVLCNGYAGETDLNGLYQILNIEPGTYSVTFTDPYGRYQEVTI